MDVDERNRLHNRLVEVLGAEEARTLMSSVPMQEMATGTDILMVRQDIDLVKKDIEVLGAKLREEMHRGFRNQTIALTTMVALFNGVMLAVLKFG